MDWKRLSRHNTFIGRKAMRFWKQQFNIKKVAWRLVLCNTFLMSLTTCWLIFRTNSQKGHRKHDIENEWSFESAGQEDVSVFRTREQCNKYFGCVGRVRTSRTQVQCGCGYRTSSYSGRGDPRGQGMIRILFW